MALLLGGGVFVLVTRQDRATTLEAASAEMQQLVILMAEQVRSAINADRIVLSRMDEMLRSRGIRGLQGSFPDQQRLRQILADDQAIQSLLILDPEGRLVLSSHDPAAGDSLDRADRDYFRELLPPAPKRDFISPLIRGRMTGSYIFAVSRRVEDEAGRFLGVVQSSIDSDFFLTLYGRLSRDPRQTFAVYKTDGTVVLRYPLPADEKDRWGSPRFVVELARAAAGTYLSPSVFDGVDRLHAYRSIPELGLVVTSSIPTDSVFAGWRSRTQKNAAVLVVCLALLMVLAGWAWKVARHAEEAHRSESEAVRSKSNFFASASHDLRQPMQAMRLFWTVIQAQSEGTDNLLLKRAVTNLGSAMLVGEDLLNALLDIAVLESGRVVPKIGDIALSSIIADEAGCLAVIAESRHLHLRTVATRAMVRSDPVLLRRILRNLVVNAIKFTETGGVLIGCRRRGSMVLLQVWDSGRGIADSELSAIFDDLYQVDNPARDRGEGLGLGLSVVSRTAALLGCSVRVRSRPGSGSVFEIVIPAAD